MDTTANSSLNRTRISTPYTISTYNSSITTHTVRPTRNVTFTSAASTTTASGTSVSDTNNGNAYQGGTTTAGNAQSQYYYIVLAVGVCLGFFCLWLAYRRRKMVKATQNTARQRALAEDSQGWHPSRLWTSNGAGRSGTNNHDAASVHHEGLNEHGEAPPPYLHGEPVLTEHEGVVAHGGGLDGTVAIPLRAMRRSEVHSMKPPDYLETIVEPRESSSSTQSDELWRRPSNIPPRPPPD